ncbi:MAG: signal peptidase I [Acidobacteria bacterium]|nr:signal peptidase I [Acidobacteriota bacterium]
MAKRSATRGARRKEPAPGAGRERVRAGREASALEGTPPFRKSTAREYLEAIVIAVILALFVRTWVVQAYTIPTGSMEHNLLVGDYILVNKFVFGPTLAGAEQAMLPKTDVERGDIVVFKFPLDPERDFIKRIIGLPGETLEVRDKRVYIDGVALDEPYLPEHERSLRSGEEAVGGRDNHGPVQIPDGHYFAMGDNRDDSEDSRFWGPLPAGHLKGKAVVIYWSYDAGPPVMIPEPGLGAAVRRAASGAVGFFARTRWDRMLHQVR